MDDASLTALRARFPILGRSTYLVSHSLGAMPAAARERLNAYADAWENRGVRAWAEGWWGMPVTTGDKLGRLLGAAPGSIVMHQNVSVCQALILSCFEFTGKRNKIVYDDLNFPSVMYVYEAHKRLGARVEMVASEDGITVPLDKLLAAIDEETLLVPISHVVFKSAFVQDLAAITRRAHEVGALVVADLYQSAGTVPVDLTAWDVDFATGGSVKWLCGGPGAGYLYVAPRLRDTLQPRVTGWMAHARPFAFEPGEIEYASDWTRFLHGSPGIPALYAAEAGYEAVAEVGIAAIRAQSLRQVALLLDRAREHGLEPRVPTDPAQRGGMAILGVPEGEAVTRELLRREIVVDHRPGAGIRLSPHFYTTDAELLHAVDEIRAILDSGAHRKHLAAGGTGF
ncbi:MAG: aminotransferase class V-fold PLP-dependent enzyme [Vicinamibacteria bacterium]|jgi:kynureninase|nr:aminotransferase class V-fold PLP-dependent enzyme [Vicinamibacteria bacterium]